MTEVKVAFGWGLPRSNSVGCDCSFGSYLQEPTTPQTFAVPPICPAASSGLKGAAMAEEVHAPNSTVAGSSLADLILTSDGSSLKIITEPAAVLEVEPTEVLKLRT